MLFIRKTLCKPLFLLASLFVLLICLKGNQALAKKNYFPVFPSIVENVKFWEKVYSQYSTNTAVLHDKNDLSIIYEEVPILDRTLPGAAPLNRKYLKSVKSKYASILEKLGRGGQPSNDSEKRIFYLFSGPDKRKKIKAAAVNIRAQTGLRERFLEGVIRSGAYIKEMKGIFRQYGLPEDLAYLPHVESSFNINAYSKFGAAGAWQFTRSTGKEFMKINYIIDERRDLLISTKAAAEYLKRNFDTLGTWPLAITAYNYGHAGMQRALLQEGTYERIFTNYRKGWFKFASRNFYSEFIAARNVAKHLEKSPSLKLDSPRKTFHAYMRGYAHIEDLSSHYRLNKEILKEFNPSLRSPVWNGEKYVPKNYQLRLPYSKNTMRLAATMPGSIFKNSQKRSNFYTVKSGDTAGKIAQKHGVSLKSLSRANNLNKKAVVYIGQTLRIPSPSKEKSYVRDPAALKNISVSSVTVPELRGNKKSLPSWNTIIPQQLPANYEIAVRKVRNIGGINHGEITVQPEESLGIYAEWLKTSEGHLNSLNKLKGNDIHPGQMLLLPFKTVSRKNFEEKRNEFHQETEEDFFSSYRVTGFQKYKVAMGDTLWEICQNKFDLPLWLLKKYNTNLNYNRLNSNQHLNIPIIEAL